MAQRSVSNQQFSIHIKPQLRGILTEFYHMLPRFPDYPEKLVEIQKKMQELSEIKSALVTCPRKTKATQCLGPLKLLQKNLNELDLLSFEAIQSFNARNETYLSNLMGQAFFQSYTKTLQLVDTNTEVWSMTIGARNLTKTEWDPYQTIKHLDEMQSYLSLSLVEFIPYIYQQDFRNFYFNLISPLEKNIDTNSASKFFQQNVEMLNFHLNLLNQNLTKRNKKTPENMSSSLFQIHSRWNSVLKYYY
ncbi:MAG: hypothetical protein R3A51_22250 [Nannocystaceae bacterium]